MKLRPWSLPQKNSWSGGKTQTQVLVCSVVMASVEVSPGGCRDPRKGASKPTSLGKERLPEQEAPELSIK